jgi:hypothetical protein
VRQLKNGAQYGLPLRGKPFQHGRIVVVLQYGAKSVWPADAEKWRSSGAENKAHCEGNANNRKLRFTSLTFFVCIDPFLSESRAHMRGIGLLLLVLLCMVYMASSNYQLRGPTNVTEALPSAEVREVVTGTSSQILKKAAQTAFKGGFYAASAGLVQVICLMWLRTTVNYQYRYGVPMLTALQQLYQQGGIARFYKGVTFALLISPISKFGAVAANEWSKIFVASYYPVSSAGDMAATILGTALTVLWRVFLMPIETCKTVLQVDGASGFAKLMGSVQRGQLGVLYRGSTAAILAVAAGHYPWFLVYNILDKYLVKQDHIVQSVGRSALIGFAASAASDTFSNVLRVLKTVKQATGADGRRALTYLQIAESILREGGLAALFGRGLLTRLLTNGIQSVLFTVLLQLLPLLWKR